MNIDLDIYVHFRSVLPCHSQLYSKETFDLKAVSRDSIFVW